MSTSKHRLTCERVNCVTQWNFLSRFWHVEVTLVVSGRLSPPALLLKVPPSLPCKRGLPHGFVTGTQSHTHPVREGVKFLMNLKNKNKTKNKKSNMSVIFSWRYFWTAPGLPLSDCQPPPKKHNLGTAPSLWLRQLVAGRGNLRWGKQPEDRPHWKKRGLMITYLCIILSIQMIICIILYALKG